MTLYITRYYGKFPEHHELNMLESALAKNDNHRVLQYYELTLASILLYCSHNQGMASFQNTSLY